MCFLAAAGAAASGSVGPLFGPSSPRFAADFSTVLEPDGQSSLLLQIEVPYTECQFVRVPAGYGAALEFLAMITDGKDHQIAGDVWEERFVLATFPETRDGGSRIAVTRTLRAPAGKYHLKVRVRDANGGLSSQAETSVQIAGLGKSTLALGDLVFGSCRTREAAGEGFERSASRRFTDDVATFCVKSSVYDLLPASSPRSYHVRYRIQDESGRDQVSGDTVLVGEQARSFFLHPNVSGLFLGSYRFEIEVQEAARQWKTEGSFDIEAVTAPRGTQWATMLEILEYVATTEQLGPLRKARSDEDRAERWREFWARRDPTPETPRNEALLEFMRRVRYATAQFQGFGPGWRTDQGRIYIQNGNPDQIEDLPATHSNPPLQIWHYFSLNRRYIFADRDGFGRYELITVAGP